ncbi:uncharacterized protein LOC135682438 [Rhopilema esculentum]|uniref:uncharacterized protein LOC135682438 n=1 Tax=Rhopilema esculentum TaxID=499914 RepID=UPI0031DC7C89
MASNSRNIDNCESCMKQTKYICITCGVPVCTVCCLEELDEETQGWIPCRSVGYCSVCKVQQFESSKVELISPSSPNSNKEDEEADFESGNESNADGPPLKKRKKEKKSGRKTSWPDTLLADFIDIIVSNEYFKKKLIFQNVKNQKNGEIYGNILKELKKRVHARNENCNYTVIQLRNKFKKVVGECKKAAFVMKTASGIKRFQEEKNYGVWFNQLLELVKTRESCQPEQAIEPSERSFDSTSECVAPAESTPEFFIPVMKGTKKSPPKEQQFKEMLGLMKNIAEKDPMSDFLKFMREQEERERKHELAVISLIMNQQTMPPQQQQFLNYSNMNPVIQQHPYDHNTMNHMAGSSSAYNSFMQELNSVNETSEKTFTKL